MVSVNSAKQVRIDNDMIDDDLRCFVNLFILNCASKFFVYFVCV